jgi:hypothetical protein
VGPTRIFRSLYGRVLTVLVGAIGLLVVVTLGATQGVVATVTTLPVAGLLVLAAWAVFWRPEVEVSDGEVVVRNVLRTTRAPWPTVRAARTDWSLVLETTEGEVSAWAAPRASGTAQRMSRRRDRDVRGTPAGDPGTVVREHATAEAVAEAIDQRQTALLEAGHLRGAGAAVRSGQVRPTTTWNVGTIGSALLLVAAAVTARLLV